MRTTGKKSAWRKAAAGILAGGLMLMQVTSVLAAGSSFFGGREEPETVAATEAEAPAMETEAPAGSTGTGLSGFFSSIGQQGEPAAPETQAPAWDPAAPEPVAPAPAEPAPAAPEPATSEAVAPEPVAPAPAEPLPPAPVEPAPVEPAPAPAEPEPAQVAAAPAEEASEPVTWRPSFFNPSEEAQVEPVVAAAAQVTAAPGLTNVVNLGDFYLNDTQLRLLEQNSFFVMLDQDKEFFHIYESNRYNVLPNFVTVDSMMHTYHLYFMHLMKNLEKGYLSELLAQLATGMAERSNQQLEALRGTEWESAAVRNAAFFAVGSSLLGYPVASTQDVQSIVDQELALISSASGIAYSPLLGGENMEDYSQYIVRGYYTGSEELQRYFRAMMWFGRMNFRQNEEDLDRSALLITLGMDVEMFSLWDTVYSVTSFFAGSSDDNGYYEYAPLAIEAYGEDVTIASLIGNAAGWQRFHELTGTTPAPQINSVPGMDTGTEGDHVAENKGFRFMGQRFSLDAAAFQQLVHNKVEYRMLPNALDIPAALGSDEAYAILEQKGETAYVNYPEQMAKVRESLANAPETLWNASLYSRWLYTLTPLLEQKGDGYPAFMQSAAWARKNLQSFLGSYAELKHDTVLYSKQIMVEMGGGDEPVRDDRGYVEPEPEVFGRLRELVNVTRTGLKDSWLLSEEDEANLLILEQLATQLETIARKELRSEALTDEEYELIRSFGGQLEHFWREAVKDDATSEYFTSREFPSAIVTDIATDPNGQVLEIATGNVSEIYVLVPIDGELHLCTGAVFSFYQFPHPLSDRLTDSSWRQMMGIELGADESYHFENAKDVEDWTRDFSYSWKWENP